MPELTSKAFVFKHPHLLCGANMRVLIPCHPELAFVEGYETRTLPHEYLPTTIGISYPCPETFNYMMGLEVVRCRTKTHPHGHVLIGGDDGVACLPHLIHSAADIRQVIGDLVSNRFFDCYLGKEAGWEATLEAILLNDPVTKALPAVSDHPVQSFDLRRLAFAL